MAAGKDKKSVSTEENLLESAKKLDEQQEKQGKTPPTTARVSKDGEPALKQRKGAAKAPAKDKKKSLDSGTGLILPNIPKPSPPAKTANLPDESAGGLQDDGRDAFHDFMQQQFYNPVPPYMMGNYPPPMPPPWAFHGQGPMSDSEEEEPEESMDYALHTLSSDSDSGEVASMEVDGSDSLESVMKKAAGPEVSPTGPPVAEAVADTVNHIWIMQHKEIAKTFESHSRPKNLSTHKVDVNEQMLLSMTVPDRKKDIRMRSVQGCIVGAATVAAKALDTLMGLDTASVDTGIKHSLQHLVTLTMDGLKFLSHANCTANNVRKSNLTSALAPDYKHLGKEGPTLDSPNLFGDALQDKVKAIAESKKMTVKRSGFRQYGNYHYQSYPQKYRGKGRGYSQYPGYHHPKYSQGYGGYKAPFLGKSDFTSDDDSDVSISTQVESELESDDPSLVSRTRPEEIRLPEQERQGQQEVQVIPTHGAAQMTEAEVGKSLSGLPSIDICKWPQFQAGRLSQCVHEWAKITSDPKILSDIRGHKIEFDEIPKQFSPPHPMKYTKEEHGFLKEKIAEYLNAGVIQKAKHEKGEVISNIFLVPKKEKGKFRMILNLKNLNLDVEYQHFKMDTIQSALRLVTRFCWMMSLDIKDAYFSVNICKPDRKYLRFLYEGQLYEFTCLPNGLSSGPRLFTKILKVPLSHLRDKHDVDTSAFIDDCFLEHPQPRGVYMSFYHMAELFQKLGFSISPKSIVFPGQKMVHVGFLINSILMIVSLPPEKVQDVLQFVQKCLACRTMTIRMMAQLLGKLEATGPGNRYAQLFTKRLAIHKNRALAEAGYDYEKTAELSRSVREDMAWWVQNLDKVWAPIFVSVYEDVIYTDASTRGWGCWWPAMNHKFGGQWSVGEAEDHINVLELRAVYHALLSMPLILEQTRAKRVMKNMHLRVMTDNTTTMLCIRNQGSVRSIPCNNMTRQIWDWAIKRNVWLSTAHVPGVDNVHADEASREFQDESEWQLNPKIFQDLVTAFGNPMMDLFATRLNWQVKPYCAWQPDPEAAVIDAFTIKWGGGLLYAFPPFALIGLTLQKIVMDRAELILVVPKWPTQTWFAFLKRYLIQDPIEIPLKWDTLRLKDSVGKLSQKQHPRVGKMNLWACHLRA